MRLRSSVTARLASPLRPGSRQCAHICEEASEEYGSALLNSVRRLDKRGLSQTRNPGVRFSCCKAIVGVLASAARSGKRVPRASLETVALAIQWRPIRRRRIECPARYNMVLRALLQHGVRLTKVFQDIGAELILCVQEHAFGNLNTWLLELIKVRVQSSTLWDSGLSTAFHQQLQTDICNVHLADMLHLAFLLQRTATHRLELWEELVFEIQRRTSSPQSVVTRLSRLTSESFFHVFELARRSPFLANAPLFGPELLDNVPTILSKLCLRDFSIFLLALKYMLSPSQFLQRVISPCADLLRRRLTDVDALGTQRNEVLYALNADAHDPSHLPWWRNLVIRPWAQELRDICRIVLQRSRAGEYEQELEAVALSDIGSWTFPVFGALQIEAPSSSYIRSAARNVLRHRRHQSLSNAREHTRALGFARWSLFSCTSGELLASSEGQLLRSRSLKAEDEQSMHLVSVSVGLLRCHPSSGSRRRGGDVERRALEMVLEDLHTKIQSSSKDDLSFITGYVDIFVDRLTCLSCLGAVLQFGHLLPAVRVRLACAAPPWLSRPLSRQCFHGKLA